MSAFAACLLTLLVWPTLAHAAVPALPQVFIDTAMPSLGGATVKTVCAASCDFTSINSAVNHASVKNAGVSVVRVRATAAQTFTETITLPVHTNGWVIVESSALASLPTAGVRVGPSHVAHMPTIMAPSGGVAVQTETSASRYRLVGLEVTSTGANQTAMLLLGDASATVVSDQPSSIIIDRCYLHPNATTGSRRGVAFHGASLAVIDSYLSDWKEVGADSQAIGGWSGPGPFKIVNNYLEGAGENVMFGGGDPSIQNLVPSDIEIRRNHFAKPLAWKIGDPSYAGTPWSVKNLFELKNARRVLIEGNLFERNWLHAQSGFAVVFTPRNQGTAPWSVVEDVTFRHNIVRHTSSGINILGYDDGFPSQPTKRVAIYNNLFYDVSTTNWGGDGLLIQILTESDAPADVLYEHNTGLVTRMTVWLAGQAGAPPITYRNNLVGAGQYGISGSGQGFGLPPLDYYVPNSVVSTNVFINNGAYYTGTWPPVNYPATSLFAASIAAVGFVDAGNDNYRLTTGSPYHNAATDGSDIGVNIDALNAALGLSNTSIQGITILSGSGSLQ